MHELKNTPELNTKLNRGPAIVVDNGDTLANAIRRRLADLILANEFPSGAKLDEQELASAFGVSRTPVREALRQLDASGLVEIRPRRGAIIVPVDKEKIGLAFEAAAELESVTASWAAVRATLGERKQLLKLNNEGADAVAARDGEWFAAVNRRLHAAIWEFAHNPNLTEAIVPLRTKTAPYEKSRFVKLENIRTAQSEHDGIIEAICFQDHDRARRAMKEHILRASLAVI